jgi:DNA mismatch repair ATPase MutS
VTRLLAAAGLQRNPLLHFLLNALLPWDFWVSHRLAERKQKLAGVLPGWLHIWFELEALSSLATFAYLNPDYTFADLQPPGAGPLLVAQEVGHPLIPHAQRVGNDFRIGRRGELAIVTGSNMAGKSSFLRTMGVAVRLGLVGTAIPAHSLALQPLRLFTSIQVQDSLADGFSFFYAEVSRLRALLDALPQGETPLLYLIDEIFRGTNNRERLLGSRAYVRALVNANDRQQGVGHGVGHEVGHGVGLIATHDLELTSLAEETPTITNYHFRDDVENGRMVFDYKLRPGPCPTTNALRVMALAGLPVGEATTD